MCVLKIQNGVTQENSACPYKMVLQKAYNCLRNISYFTVTRNKMDDREIHHHVKTGSLGLSILLPNVYPGLIPRGHR